MLVLKLSGKDFITICQTKYNPYFTQNDELNCVFIENLFDSFHMSY